MKVALLTNMPTPYREPSYRALTLELKKRATQLVVLFDVEREGNRHWQVDLRNTPYDYQFSRGFTVNLPRRRRFVAFEDDRAVHFRFVLLPLVAQKPDIVVSAEFGARTIQAILYKMVFRKQCIIWSEGTLHTESEIPWFKKALRKWLVTKADGLWTNGTESTELMGSYFRGELPPTTEKMTGIDTQYFLEQGEALAPKREDLRAQLGIDGVALLYIGQFIPRKGIHQLIRELLSLDKKLQNRNSRITITFVGAGEVDVRKALRGCSAINLVYPGSVANKDLVNYFAASDLFVMPTLEDNWPLSCLEAMVSGLPVISTPYNGASADLIDGTSTGQILDILIEGTWANAIEALLETGIERISYAHRRCLAQTYSPSAFARRATDSLALL